MKLGRIVGLVATVMVMAAPLQECGTPTPPQPPGECTTNPTPDASLIPNGDFNEGYVDVNNPGAPGTQTQTAYAPDPWEINFTPDFSTDERVSFNSFGSLRTDLAGFDSSPAGGSFMGFRSIGASFNEGIFNTLQVNDPTEEMTIFFYYTEYTSALRTSVPPPNDPGVNIQFRFDVDFNAPAPAEDTGALISDVQTLSESGGVQGTWEERRITFTPADLGYTQPGNYNFYLGTNRSVVGTWAFVDGLVVNRSVELCPEPTTTTTIVEPTTTTLIEPTTTVPTTPPTPVPN
jgi:hypothetical protein